MPDHGTSGMLPRLARDESAAELYEALPNTLLQNTIGQLHVFLLQTRAIAETPSGEIDLAHLLLVTETAEELRRRTAEFDDAYDANN